MKTGSKIVIEGCQQMSTFAPQKIKQVGEGNTKSPRTFLKVHSKRSASSAKNNPSCARGMTGKQKRRESGINAGQAGSCDHINWRSCVTTRANTRTLSRPCAWGSPTQNAPTAARRSVKFFVSFAPHFRRAKRYFSLPVDEHQTERREHGMKNVFDARHGPPLSSNESAVY